MFAIHAAVLPLDGQRAAVLHVVQRSDDLLEPHAAASQTAEVPTTTGIAERQVAGQNAGPTVQVDPRVLHVNVVDAIGNS